MASTPPAGELPAALRELATRVAEVVGGGLALVFQCAPGDDPARSAGRLRAAAGFATADAARQAARVLAALPVDGIDAAQPSEPLPELGPRAAGALWIQPLVWGGRRHGTLVAAAPGALAAPQLGALQELATRAGLQLDHAELAQEVLELRRKVDSRETSDEDRNEEILKLSEALFAQDIEILRSNEKLGKIEKLKNDFIEKMSRELRTPLNSIIEAVISVLTGEDAALSEDAKSNLRRALDDGTAFLRTLQNILDLWRIRQGELPVEVQDVNLGEVIEEVIFSFQDEIAAKSLRVEPKIDASVPKLRTDLTKLNQILFLLLDNAVRFTHEGAIEINARLDEGKLLCEVRDTGIGICADDQQFIFDEFYQVDDEADASHGAGLGLALVRDLLLLLDGDIAVASDAGRGTSVTFRLPVQALAP